MRDVKIKNPNLEIVEGPHADDPVLAPRDDHVLPVPLVHLALCDAQDLTTLQLKDFKTLKKVWALNGQASSLSIDIKVQTFYIFWVYCLFMGYSLSN